MQATARLADAADRAHLLVQHWEFKGLKGGWDAWRDTLRVMTKAKEVLARGIARLVHTINQFMCGMTEWKESALAVSMPNAFTC